MIVSCTVLTYITWASAREFGTHRISICAELQEPSLLVYTIGAPGVLGIWGEWLFIFRELGSTGNYFRETREQAHNFGDLGSPTKKQKKKKGKASILFDFLKIACPQITPPPLVYF